MFRLGPIGKMALVIVGLTTLALMAAPANKGKETFTSREKGFTISLPGGWEQKKDVMGAVIVAISPLEGPKDIFRENVNVVVEDLATPMSSKDYFNNSVRVLKQLFKDFKLEKQGVAKINNRDFHWSMFTHRLGEVKAKVLQYMVVNGKRAYVITCSATPDAFKHYQARFEESAKSFRFEGSPGLASTKEK